jgi:hypothetical protein
MTPPNVFGPFSNEPSPRTMVSLSAPVIGMIEGSVRWSQPIVMGTPSSITAAWRESEPRIESSISPRELSRTWTNGDSRSAWSSSGAGDERNSIGFTTTALEPPTMPTAREPLTVTVFSFCAESALVLSLACAIASAGTSESRKATTDWNRVTQGPQQGSRAFTMNVS